VHCTAEVAERPTQSEKRKGVRLLQRPNVRKRVYKMAPEYSSEEESEEESVEEEVQTKKRGKKAWKVKDPSITCSLPDDDSKGKNSDTSDFH
jgi:hypothetical protein